MQKSFETPGPVALDLRLPAGEIEIDPSLEGRVEVELVAHDEESQRLVDASRVELRESGGTYRVLVDVPSKKTWGISISFGREGISCRVRCPEGSSLEAHTKSAGIEGRGTLGKVSVQTASGEVSLRRVEGDLSATSASGDVSAEVVAGDVSVHTASGDVELGTVEGDLRVNAVSGDVTVAAAGGDASVQTVSGGQTLGAVTAGSLRANAVSGDVRVGVRRGSRVHLDCTTVSGDTRSELELSSEPVGDGPQLDIRAKTVSGDITITRAPAPAGDSQEVHA